MLQIELTTQLRRMRSLLVYGGLAAIIVIAGLTESPKSGGKGGPATFSALNFTEAGLNFLDPVLLGLIIALLGSIIGGSDREWGTLRYLYVRPVSRARLVAGKWWALVVCCALAIVVYLGFALVTGLVFFGWHPYHRAGSAALSTATAFAGVLEAGGYVMVCMLSIGAIALALGLLLPRSAEALAITIAFLVGSVIIDNVKAMHDLVVILPVHYWSRYANLFKTGAGGFGLGLTVQAATIVVVLGAAYAILARRDPAA